MASLLRTLVASPRTRHQASNLDLAYITPFIVATSGPSSTYPSLAYRNPLSQLVAFLDAQHGENWCIWEFRAEGTGYPDSEVRGKVRHWPWPDHHPPPFEAVRGVMAEMASWLEGEGEGEENGEAKIVERKRRRGDEAGNGRVVVVHCKAGKGRSGTMACSYLISECGWSKVEALKRFTERRMRQGFGEGVSIPSQLRYVDYVDRWTKGGKIYEETAVEILEVQVTGLRDGVKVAIEGYVDGGKKIKTWHVFGKKERTVLEGNAPGGKGWMDMIGDMYQPRPAARRTNTDSIAIGLNQLDGSYQDKVGRDDSTLKSSEDTPVEIDPELGGSIVSFKPAERLILPTSDINIDFERRNHARYGMTMVTSVAHVWFNAFFECNGPEQQGKADENGYFEIEWDKMDGIKGSLKKGTRALDRVGVVFRRHYPSSDVKPVVQVPVPESRAADWKGNNDEDPEKDRSLGLRVQSPLSADVSKANSVKSNDGDEEYDTDEDPAAGVKTSGPDGGDIKTNGK